MASAGTAKFNHFLEQLTDLVEESLQKVTVEELQSKCPKDLLKLIGRPTKIMKIKATLEEGIKDAFLEAATEVLSEADVQSKFEDLYKLKKSLGTENTTKAWRPPGNVEIHMRSIRVEVKKKQKMDVDNLIKLKQITIKDSKKMLEDFMIQVPEMKKIVEDIEDYRAKVLEKEV